MRSFSPCCDCGCKDFDVPAAPVDGVFLMICQQCGTTFDQESMLGLPSKPVVQLEIPFPEEES